MPNDYEPEYFKTSSMSGLSFAMESIRAKIGRLETPYLSTEAKYHGLESLLHENLCKIGRNESSKQTGTIFQATTKRSSEEIEQKMESMDVSESYQDLTSDDETDYKRVREYCLLHGKCVTLDISIDLNIKTAKLQKIVKKLTEGEQLRTIFSFKE